MIADYFKFAERGTNLATEARGGLTTFMVMVYIVFVNSSILTAGFGLDAAGATAVSAATALIAGIMTIAMGVFGNYPFALAAGLGINAIVAFGLTARGLTPGGRHGRDRPRGRRRHDPRPRGLPRGGDERHPAVAQACDRGGHRPVHPVHRPVQRRDHHLDRCHALRGDVRPGPRAGVPNRARPVRLPHRAAADRGPVGSSDQGRPGDLDPGDNSRSPSPPGSRRSRQRSPSCRRPTRSRPSGRST